MSDKKELVEKYTRPKYPALVKPEPEAADADEDGRYRAFVQHMDKKNASRFRVIDRRGYVYGCGYAYLLGWLYTPPETLSIQTTTHVFILTGTALHKIEESLLREKIRDLREFNPDHDQEPDEGEPKISGLAIISRFDERGPA